MQDNWRVLPQNAGLATALATTPMSAIHKTRRHQGYWGWRGRLQQGFQRTAGTAFSRAEPAVALPTWSTCRQFPSCVYLFTMLHTCPVHFHLAATSAVPVWSSLILLLGMAPELTTLLAAPHHI